MTTVEKILQSLKEQVVSEIEGNKPKPTFYLNDQGELDFSETLRRELEMHTIVDSMDVEHGDKVIHKHIYGNNRILFVEHEDKLMLLTTDAETLHGLPTGLVYKNGKCKQTSTFKFIDTLSENLQIVTPGDVFAVTDIEVTPVGSVGRVVTLAELEENTTGQDTASLDELTIDIPATIEQVAEQLNEVEQVEVVSEHAVPVLPE